MIDEKNIDALEKMAADGGIVIWPPETLKALAEVVRFYRRTHDRRLGDLLELEEKASGLFRRLAHGNGPHRFWLLEELERALPGVKQQGPDCVGCFDSGEIKRSQFETPVPCPACRGDRRVTTKPTPKSVEADRAIAEFRNAPDGDGDAD